MNSGLPIADPELAELARLEEERISLSIDLVASLNYPSKAVLDAQNSVFAIRRCEGYPGRRYHGGTRYLDKVEDLARERAKQLFGAEHANIQPHSGVNANWAVYFAVLKPGDPILSMNLVHGGHLSHGHPATASGRFYRACFYGVDRSTELIDYAQMRAIAAQVRPRMIICGGSSYPRTIDFARFRQVADEVGAYLLADVSHYAGLIAAKVYPSPVPFSDFVTFTTYKTLRGCPGGVILSRACYANAIDSAIFPGTQGTMHSELMAAKAVTFRLAMTEAFERYARQVLANARVMAEGLEDRGYRIVTGGTDCHMVLLDLVPRGLTGKKAQEVLESVGIITNKNVIPFDSQKPDVTSGLRLGTSSITSRGFGEAEVAETAALIATVLDDPEDAMTLQNVRDEVRNLCARFPPDRNGGCVEEASQGTELDVTHTPVRTKAELQEEGGN